MNFFLDYIHYPKFWIKLSIDPNSSWEKIELFGPWRIDKTMVNRERLQPRPKRDLLKEQLARIEYGDGNLFKPMVDITDSVFELWRVMYSLARRACYQTVGQEYWLQNFEGEIGDDVETRSGLRYARYRQWLLHAKIWSGRGSELGDGWGTLDGFGSYLTVQTWTPDLASPSAKIEKTMV